MRSISRVVGVSINSVARLLVQAGEACTEFHDEHVREVSTTHVQCDELWSFCYAKAKNVEFAKAAPAGAGDVWTWTALADDPRLILTWAVSPDRGAMHALEFLDERARSVGPPSAVEYGRLSGVSGCCRGEPLVGMWIIPR